MTNWNCWLQDKTINDVLELLFAEGFEGMADAMRIMLNEAGLYGII